MSYSKPILRALDLNVDVASCKPAPPPPVCEGTEVRIGDTKYCIDLRTQPNCPGLHVSNLCFATKSVTVAHASVDSLGIGLTVVAPVLP